MATQGAEVELSKLRASKRLPRLSATIELFSLARARQYGWGVLSPAATLVLSVATYSVASRALDRSDFGRFAAATAVIALLTPVVELGMPMTLVRFAGATPPDDEGARRRYRLAAWTLVLTGSILLAISLGAARALSVPMERWIPESATLAVVLAVSGSAFVNLASAEAQTTLQFGRYFAKSTGSALVRIVGVIAALFIVGPTVEAALWGYGLSMFLFGLALGWRGLRSVADVLRLDRERLRGDLRELRRFAAPIVGSALVVSALSYLDTLVLAGVLLPRDLAMYAAGVRLTAIQSALIAGSATLALPLATRALRLHTEREFAERIMILCGVLGIVVTILLVGVAPLLVKWVYGSAYGASSVVLVISAIGILANFPGNALSSLLYAAGRSGFMFVVQLAQLFVLAAGLVFVTKSWGIIGVASYRGIVNTIAVLIIIAEAIRLAHNAPASRKAGRDAPVRAA